jgi:hypothetical protein
VPLRSVEAASRDDAIAAAREQFGPQARVVGVRRVRSGGVLGFFATERYVAEVAAEPAGRPVVPVPASSRSADTDRFTLDRDDLDRDDAAPADFSSPLASAAPARARVTAPARNGAAAWAAEAAARTPDAAPAPRNPTARAATPVHPAAAAPKAEEERVSELAGLLTTKQSDAATPTYARTTFPRAAFPRTDSQARTNGQLFDDEDDQPIRGGERRVLPAEPTSGAPSPFTAALARMVAGDQDVRQAVKEALDQPAGAFGRAAAAPSPTWPGPIAPAESPVAPPAARQEEETVGDQVIAPPSPVTDRAVEVPTWAAEPEIPAASVSPREEAIADLLRGALAQGHSDEALAGILRKVLAGASPQTALHEPEVPAPVPAPTVVLTDNVLADVAPAADVHAVAAPVEPMFAEVVVPEAVHPVDEPAEDVPAVTAPDEVAEDAAVLAPEPEVVEVAQSAVEPYPWTYESTDLFGEVTAVAAPSLEMWGIPMAEVPLWGEPVATPSVDEPIWGHTGSTAGDPAIADDAPIWAEVTWEEPAEVAAPAETLAAPAVEAPDDHSFDSGIFGSDDSVSDLSESDASVSDDLGAAAAAEADVEDEVDVVEQSEVLAAEEAVEEYVAASEVEIAEMAPMMARTASDPAPMMSLDATTVMPPLSLLPPLPSSRGRGRPPVPMSPSRSSARSRAPKPTPPAPPAPEAVTPEATTPEADFGVTAAVEPASSHTPPAETPRVDAGLFDEPTVTTPVAKAASPRPPVVETSAQSSAAPRFLATVTRLPVAPLMASEETPEMPELDEDEPAASAVPAATEPAVDDAPAAPAPVVHSAPGDVTGRLEALGVPAGFLGASFADDAAVHGTYAALTRALALRLSKAPELPSGAGEILFVVGPGVETLRAAQSLAASLRLDPDRVQWATRGDLAGLAPKGSRMTTVETAIDRRQDAADAGTVTIVAVDAPLRTDAYWMAQMLAIWSPVAVWAVVEATRKPEDLEPWLDGLPRVDALVVQDTDLSADPAAVLRRVDIPVALLDGVPATPHRWASLLCERLESTKA